MGEPYVTGRNFWIGFIHFTTLRNSHLKAPLWGVFFAPMLAVIPHRVYNRIRVDTRLFSTPVSTHDSRCVRFVKLTLKIDSDGFVETTIFKAMRLCCGATSEKAGNCYIAHMVNSMCAFSWQTFDLQKNRHNEFLYSPIKSRWGEGWWSGSGGVKNSVVDTNKIQRYATICFRDHTSCFSLGDFDAFFRPLYRFFLKVESLPNARNKRRNKKRVNRF